MDAAFGAAGPRPTRHPDVKRWRMAPWDAEDTGTSTCDPQEDVRHIYSSFLADARVQHTHPPWTLGNGSNSLPGEVAP